MVQYRPVQTNQMPHVEKLVQRVWEIVRVVLCRPTPFFMRKWRRFLTVKIACLCGGARQNIAQHVSFSCKCRVDYPWRLSIDEYSSIGDGAWVYALDKITIGRNVCIGEDVRLITGSHDITNNKTYNDKEQCMGCDCSDDSPRCNDWRRSCHRSWSSCY